VCFANGYGYCCDPSVTNSCGVCGIVQCDGTCADPCGGGGGGDGCYGQACNYPDDCCPGYVCESDDVVAGGTRSSSPSPQIVDNGSCFPGGGGDAVIVGLNGGAVRLTGAQNGVTFDFLGRGETAVRSWTRPGSDDGWLALDRNGNWRIDDATELFGNLTPQPRSSHGLGNGFAALAVFDQPEYGGNGDGQIDRRDAVFSRLLVWVDKNHNGVSDPGELLTMQQAGVQSISLHYERSKLTDAYGNQFIYRTRITLGGDNPKGDRYAYDVILAKSK
jgi:hypothetical protein